MKYLKTFIKFNESLDDYEEENNIKERFDLDDEKSIEDIENNIIKILYEYSNRKMGYEMVKTYLNSVGSLAKEYINKNNIKSADELRTFLERKHSFARKGKSAERKKSVIEYEKEIQNIKSEFHIQNIMDMALQQSNDMEERIKKGNN